MVNLPIQSTEQAERLSLAGALLKIREAGWTPGCVIDVGIAMGTPGLYSVWEGAPLLLVDPARENLPYMEQIAAKHRNVQIFNVGASNRDGTLAGRIWTALGQVMLGNTKLKEGMEAREFPILTVDTIVRQSKTKPPYLLKIDTDTHELEILEGSAGMLAQTDVCILEAKAFNALKKKASPADLCRRMFDAGFELVDVVDIARNREGFTRIFDLMFVRTDSELFMRLSELSVKHKKAAGRAQQREAALAANPYAV